MKRLNSAREKSSDSLFLLNPPTADNGVVILNKDRFVQAIENIANTGGLAEIKNRVLNLRSIITFCQKDTDGILNITANGETITLRRAALKS